MRVEQSGVDVHGTPPLEIPLTYNYIAVFLTLACNLRCSYCINRFVGGTAPVRWLTAQQWVSGLNRLVSRPDLPITIQGGEPSLHPGFYQIIEGMRPDLNLDLLTNLQFDVDIFMARVPAWRFKREAPYASIRVSYHPESMELSGVKDKVLKMLAGGYSVGIWAVDHPAWQREVEQARAECDALGIDFRVKEFLGVYQGRQYGTYKFPAATTGVNLRPATCRTTELLIDPAGNIHRCHSDLYAGRESLGNLLDPKLRIVDEFRPCEIFGSCNPCDVKIKTNRRQQFGHTSVDIRF